MVTWDEIHDFVDILKRKLPGYIIPDVVFNSQKDGLLVSLSFPDASKVSTLVRIDSKLTLNEGMAREVLVEILDRSLTNLKSHEERIAQLKYLIESEE